MSFITERPKEIVFYKGKKYRINPAFDVILDIQKLYREDTLSAEDKLETALLMLGLSKMRLLSVSMKDKAGLLDAIYVQSVNVKQRPQTKPRQPVLDFDEDAEYIYASFMLDYGIDLVKQQGRLSWRAFIYLFQGLSSKSKIKEVMRIRDMDIPQPTKHNQKEIQNIIELKSYYALPVHGGGGQDGLNRLFDILESLAVNGGGR
ncbi:bacteriophage Gp15 family protein [Ruminococcus sp. OA3]|uniref:Gp15 family bacteriophage protein n=1 Tax=Ruminococcus sp. OA3 TaxID=2914164 RepID=UPI001F06522A|nr:Gp15 family bacteriophage protein [Ruminococcus sp. OA3]MCH1984163.1 bacteriophage Gp15 family protein [Ruminococcus sp. OA3]